MNEVTYSFIGSLRAWLRENESVLLSHNIRADMSPYTLHSGVPAHFVHEHFEAGFYIWEKGHWHLAMSDIEFVDWRLADKDPDYQIEWRHYEYATILEMWKELDALRDRMLLVHQKYL